uniref:Non-specific serine/threonine protein kinase n=1 Tax=Panagrolaimus sp. JU765 TaxID=591449 RepID=A0AC34Q9S2_9BILA
MTDNTNHLASGSEGGVLSIFDIEKKHFLSQTATVDTEYDGGFTKIKTIDHLIYGLTTQSSIYCYDKRMTTNRNLINGLETLFYRKARNSYGFITSMSIDPINQHWMILTSSTAGSNNIFLYDLRFLALEVSSWGHPNIKTVVLNSWPIIPNNGNDCNQLSTSVSKEGEISIWNLKSGQGNDRSHILWPGGENNNELKYKNLADDVLNYDNDLQTTALIQSIKLNGLFTGDTQGSLRFWSLTQPQRCNYLSGPYRKHLTPPLVQRQCSASTSMAQPDSSIFYRRVDSNTTTIIKEDRPKLIRKDVFQHMEKDYDRMMPVGEQHRDGITDLGLISDDYLISTGRDGVVKVWKIFNN